MKKIWSLHALMRTMTFSLTYAEKYIKMGTGGSGPSIMIKGNISK